MDIITCYILQKSIVLVSPSRYLCKYYVLKETVMDWQSPYWTVLQCTTANHSSGAGGTSFLTSPGRAGASSNTLCTRKGPPPRFLCPLPLPVSSIAVMCKIRMNPGSGFEWGKFHGCSIEITFQKKTQQNKKQTKPIPHLIVFLLFFF